MTESRKFNVLTIIVIFCLARNEASNCESQHCGKYGFCGDGSCICHFGHITDDCSVATVEGRRNAVIGLQVFFGILYGTFSLLCLFGLYHSISRATSSSVVFISNVQKMIFGTMALSNLLEGLHVSIDPLESWGPVIPYVVNNMLWIQIFPAQIFCYSVLLFHWIELVNISLETLKKEYMMQKINMNYRGKEVTVEDMVEKVRTLNKLRKPFAISVGVIALLLLGSQLAKGLSQEPLIMTRLLFSVVVICWIALTLGFMIYGRRLVSIMPYQLAKRAKKLTFRLSIVSCFAAVAILAMVAVLLAIQTGNPDGDLVSWSLAEIIVFFINFAIVSVYLHWSKSWPYIVFSSRTTKSNSHHTNPENSFSMNAQNTNESATIDVE